MGLTNPDDPRTMPGGPTETPDDFMAILYCPVCCTNVDVEEVGEVKITCDTCETVFVVFVDPEKVATHSMH